MQCVKVVLISTFILMASYTSVAQIDMDRMDSIENVKKTNKRTNTSNNAVLISPRYTAIFPMGDLKNRFGFCSGAGLSISYKMVRNWMIGLEGDYLFGTRVKEDPIASISTQATGQIIGQDGTLYSIPLQMSGFDISLRVGKLIPILKKHPNSGIIISLAPGFIQHKILINANSNNVPQLNTIYRQGYDRLTNGPMVSGEIGYLYLERKKFLSLYGGITFAAGFTQERRNWNFDLMSADKHQRIDMLLGIKLAWVIPVFTNRNSEVYY
jgi:hypothetical protein